MLVKEEIFVLVSDDVEIPKFSSETDKDVLKSCINWLEKNKIKKPTIYLGLFFEPNNVGDSIQMNWEINTKLMKRIVNLKGTLCISMY